MEEKKNVTSVKLSYEQLENAAKQISSQADALVKENNQLKAALQQLSVQNSYTELNFRFKVLENHTLFDTKFVKRIVTEIEETMTPINKEEQTQEQTQENKGETQSEVTNTEKK